MTKNKLFSFIFLFLVIFASSASAYYMLELGEYHTSSETIKRSEFTAHKGPYTICGGESKIIPIWIRNKKDIKQFEFKLSRNSYAELLGDGFVLNPEQAGVLFITLNPPFGVEKNTSFNLNIYTNNQLTLRLPIELNIKDCFDVNIEIKEKEKEICACELTTYSIEVENNGDSEESFKIYLDAPEFVNLGEDFVEEVNKTLPITEKSLIIKSEDIGTVTMNVNSSCDMIGEQTIKAYAELERGEDVKASDTIILNIKSQEECYKTKVIVKNIKSNYGKSYHPVKIMNLGAKDVDYVITLDAPSWIEVDKRTLTLESMEEQTVYLELNPSDSVEENDYSIKLIITSDAEDHTEIININLQKESEVVKKIKRLISYYRYYIYAALILLVIILILLPLISSRLAKRSVRKVEEKIQSEKKIEKKTESKITKKTKKPFLNIIIIAGIIIVLGVLIYLIYKFFAPIKTFVINYLYYILIGLGALVLLIAALIIITWLKKRKPKVAAKKKPIIEKKPVIKKSVAKRKIEKKPLSEKQKKVFSFIYIIISVALLLSLIGYAIYKFFSPVKVFVITYLYYILIGLGALVILLILMAIIKKIANKSKSQKKAKASAQKTSKINKAAFKKIIIIIAALIILAGIIYAFIYFKVWNMIKDFFIVYLYYIVAGFVILILAILLLRYAKQIQDFFKKDK